LPYIQEERFLNSFLMFTPAPPYEFAPQKKKELKAFLILPTSKHKQQPANHHIRFMLKVFSR
jgi:hypothetical protein